jgi:ubiquitin carboxyl-terminal hydrolase 4/11/15
MEINIQNNHGYKGEIAESFADLFKKMQSASTQRINPIDFLRVFFTKNKSLNVRNQQDAQEFLSILLDSLHEDLNRITKKPYFQLEEQKEQESDSEASQRFWDLYKQRENSIIVDLFHGQFKSKITCSCCHKSSITYEPFVFLGLPIPQHHNQIIIHFFFGDKWECFGFELKNDSTINDLKNRAIECMKMCGYKIEESFDSLYSSIELVQCDENKIIKNIYNEHNQVDDNNLLSSILNKEKSLDIVLYEKKLDKEYFNIYCYLIKGDDYDSSLYPLVLSVTKEMTVQNIIEENKQKILKMYYNMNSEENIVMGLLHKKNNGWIYYFSNNFNSREYCPICNNNYDNYCIFNNSVQIGYVLQKLKNYNPILFTIGAKNRLINDKILQIPYKLNKGFFCLDDCLKLFCEEELLNNDNMWYCNKCKKHQTAKKQIRLFKLPPYLIIQLKKFKNSSNFFYSSNEKKYTFIKYPINDLDLTEYVEDKNGNIQKYDLYAVIQHHGEISEGHYTAICKINGIWVLFNDSIVSKISNPITNDAYLLFYRRND